MEITLLPGASAERDTCGSCKFFERNSSDGQYYRMNGMCRFVLPAKVVQQRQFRVIDPKHKDDDFTGTEDWIKDIDRCDLWQSDGKTYIVQRKVGP